MEEKLFERRKVLAGAGLAGATVLGGLAVSAPAQATGSGERLIGSWMITHTDESPSNEVGHSVVAFIPGGVLVAQEINPPGAGEVGAWRSLDGGRFTAVFWAGQPGEPGQPDVVLRIKAWGQVEGDHISGRYRGTIYDASNMSVLQTVPGHFMGHRVEA
jgi:hypothetical protein